MTTLTEFLLARIAEDEASARAPLTNASQQDPVPSDCWDPARVLTECDAKRRIVEWAPLDLGEGHSAHIFRLLALPYADHPDYREEFKP